MLMSSRTRLSLPAFKAIKNVILIAISAAESLGSRAYKKLFVDNNLNILKLSTMIKNIHN